ncbi:hypothetical protein EDD16DRAFT_333438 [Pisolithus croceorrhizus]|nr:hypothetical protein EDD16DRAFT_333438 [Pisolithus croceorrhizus]
MMHCTNTPCKEPLDLKWTATTGYIRMGSNPSAPHPPTFVSLTSRPHLLYRNCSASLRIQKSQDALSLPQCPMSCWSPAPASIRPRTPRHSPTINRTSSLLHSHESSRQYCARDFLRIARFQAAVVCACDLYYIPSQSSCYHEFLLVNVDAGHEKLMLIIERVPTNNGVMVVSSSGGVARDTITVVRAKECHEYWQRASQRPLCKGTLRWDHTPPPPLRHRFHCKRRVYHILVLQSLHSTMLLVCQDHPGRHGESVSILLQPGQYVVLEGAVYDVRKVQAITSPTPRRSSHHQLPRFTPAC